MGISVGLGLSALLPAGLGFRNLLINGDFGINQRGFSSTTTTGTYGFDRWSMIGSGGTTTYSAQTFSPGNAIQGYEPKNFTRVVSSGQSASSSYSILIQKIENVRTAAGLPVVVSFWAKAASGTPKVAIELYQYFGTGGSPSASVGTYVGQATLSTSWQRFTMTVILPSISGKTIGTTMDGAVEFNMWVSGGSDYNSRTGSLGIQSNTFDLWGVQLEQNYQPTPFEQRPIGVELALCQRYYEKSYADGVATATNTATGVHYQSSFGNASGQHFITVRFQTLKRANPTVSLWTQAGGVGAWAVISSPQAAPGYAGAASVINTTTKAFTVNQSDGGYAWQGGQTLGHWEATIEL